MYILPWPQADSLRAHPFVWGVAALCCVAYLLVVIQGLHAIAGWFVPTRPALLLDSPWRILTPSFVHYTAAHLLTNIYIWWYLGSKIEGLSRSELIALFLIAAVLSNAVQWYVSGANFGGLSGVVYALLSYCWGLKLLNPRINFQLDKGISILLLILLPVVATGLFGKYANAAHLSGLLCGAVLAGIKTLITLTKPRNPHV